MSQITPHQITLPNLVTSTIRAAQPHNTTKILALALAITPKDPHCRHSLAINIYEYFKAVYEQQSFQ
jgi:Tfp pilus assembly protein PilF